MAVLTSILVKNKKSDFYCGGFKANVLFSLNLILVKESLSSVYLVIVDVEWRLEKNARVSHPFYFHPPSSLHRQIMSSILVHIPPRPPDPKQKSQTLMIP